MTQVFLSYSREDGHIMRRLRDDLRANGVEVWTDETLEAGTRSWRAAVETALGEAACLIVLLSPDSKASEWVEREFDYMEALSKPIIPVIVRGEGETDAVPFALISYQRVDARADYARALHDLLDALQEHIADITPREARPAPLPLVEQAREKKTVEIVKGLEALKVASMQDSRVVIRQLTVGHVRVTFLSSEQFELPGLPMSAQNEGFNAMVDTELGDPKEDALVLRGWTRGEGDFALWERHWPRGEAAVEVARELLAANNALELSADNVEVEARVIKLR